MSNGLRWSKFWWQDWQNDPALKQCSFAAQGLWMRLLCLAHEAAKKGCVLINGRMPTPRQLVAQVGGTEREVVRLLAELEREGVYSRDPDGTIYSRRMRRDEKASEAGKSWGKAGGNPALNGKDNTAKNPQGGLTPPLNPYPYPAALSAPVNQAPYPPPLTGGVKLEAEVQAETELEAEERKEVYSNSLISPVLARVAAACETPPEGTYGSELSPSALQLATKTITEKLGRKLESSGKNPIGKRPKLTVVQQQDAVLRGPLIDDDTLVGELLPPIPRGPVAPQRTVAEQLAALGFPRHAAATP